MEILNRYYSYTERLPVIGIIFLAYTGWLISGFSITNIPALMTASILSSAVLLCVAISRQSPFRYKHGILSVAMVIILGLLTYQDVRGLSSIMFVLIIVIGLWSGLVSSLVEMVGTAVAGGLWICLIIPNQGLSTFYQVGLFLAIMGTAHFLYTKVESLSSTVKEADNRIRKLLNSSGEGYIAIKEGMIIDHNDQALRLLGYSSQELIGKKEELVFLDEEQAASKNKQAAVKQVVLTGQGIQKEIEGFYGEYVMNRERVRAIFFHDVTSRERANRQRRLLYKVIKLALSTKSLDKGLEAMAERIIESSEWLGAAIWVYSQEDRGIIPAAWYVKEDRIGVDIKQLNIMTVSRFYEEGEDTIGRAWKAAQGPKGAKVVKNSMKGVRARALRKYGVQTQWLVPLRHNDHTIGMLELMSETVVDDENTNKRLLEAMANQIAQFIQMCRMEATLESERALEINDDIVQHLVLARVMLTQGREEDVIHHIDEALESARMIITDLVAGADPGDLTRRS